MCKMTAIIIFIWRFIMCYGYCITLFNIGNDKEKEVDLLQSYCNLSKEEINKYLDDLPQDFYVDSLGTMMELGNKLEDIGCHVIFNMEF